MLVRHHLDKRRILRILIFIWTLLLLLVLLPIRTRGQESLEPALPVEVVEDAGLPPELVNGIAAEMVLLWCASILFLVMKARSADSRFRRP